MSAHDNIALVRHYFEENLRHPRLVRQGDCPESGGSNQVVAAIQRLGANLPDLRFTIHAIVARGDEVEVFATSEATLPGASAPQSAQRVRVSERHVLRIANGTIAAHQMDQTAQVEVWDARRGWQPLPQATSPSNLSLH